MLADFTTENPYLTVLLSSGWGADTVSCLSMHHTANKPFNDDNESALTRAFSTL
jgi:hypothetical protein